jgi:hypothetical protein
MYQPNTGLLYSLPFLCSQAGAPTTCLGKSPYRVQEALSSASLPLPQPRRVEEAVAALVVLFPCHSPCAWRRPPQHRSSSSPVASQACGRGRRKRRRRDPGCAPSAAVLRLVSTQGREKNDGALLTSSSAQRRWKLGEVAPCHIAAGGRARQSPVTPHVGSRGVVREGRGCGGVAGWVGETPTRVEACELRRQQRCGTAEERRHW